MAIYRVARTARRRSTNYTQRALQKLQGWAPVLNPLFTRCFLSFPSNAPLVSTAYGQSPNGNPQPYCGLWRSYAEALALAGRYPVVPAFFIASIASAGESSGVVST